MNKFAFLTARNKYEMPGNDLSGCVNDAEAMHALLVEVYKFPEDNIRVLTDERATQAAILDGLKWLVRHVDSELVFYNSSHGSQIRDTNGDELDDGMDEVIIPYDLDPEWLNVICDDTLGEIVDGTPSTSFFTGISDSCHSGTQFRAMNPGIRNHDGQKIRYIEPPIDIKLRAQGLHKHPGYIKRKIGSHRGLRSKVTWCALSGCRDDQTSAECKMVGGLTRGAMTYNLEKALRGTPNLTVLGAQAATQTLLRDEQFDQCPEVTGVQSMINRSIFGGV